MVLNANYRPECQLSIPNYLSPEAHWIPLTEATLLNFQTTQDYQGFQRNHAEKYVRLWNDSSKPKRQSSLRLKQTPLLTSIDGKMHSTSTFVFSFECVCVCVCFQKWWGGFVNHKLTISQWSEVSAYKCVSFSLSNPWVATWETTK